MTVAAVIVAGGSGVRAGGPGPKQYQYIGAKPVIRWTLEAFLSHPQISSVQAVIGNGHEELFALATKGMSLPPPVIGGVSRQESCRIGVEACAAQAPAKILIHDAARPFVSHDVISNVINALDYSDAAIPGIPVADTIKHAPGGMISKTVDRSSLWFVQTPQGFTYPKILAAHREAAKTGHEGLTDDAAVAELAGLPVRVVAGDVTNRKLTTTQDIEAAHRELTSRMFLERPDVRSAQGIDFHVFEKGDAIMLCGARIPHTHRLKGHSDADAAIHALTDAVLGTIGEGDIGTHFPPVDKQWKDAPSSIFLTKAMELLRAKDGVIANADITILAEAPKIAPHILAMKQALAPILGTTLDRIAIKATTTEKMGAIGRKEGIAAFATVTVRLPG
jgi:2-C-methyl-D-erythritol 4-phosphate cytidylyltransferase / 2-C-methyl-D-erythritol 2,4-cyclodiphosphate synthase